MKDNFTQIQVNKIQKHNWFPFAYVVNQIQNELINLRKQCGLSS